MSHIEGIIHLVRDNPKMSDYKLEIKIQEYLKENWVAIQGYGDE